MAIADLIRKRETKDPATAIPATQTASTSSTVAGIATIAVATAAEEANRTPTDNRIEMVVSKLTANPDLRYAMETHMDVEPEAVILTVAIQGKGACEVRIPKSRYDAFALLDLIEKHTTGETLQ